MGVRPFIWFAWVAALLAPAPAYAAATPANANAITLRPLSIIKLRDLDFGRVVTSNAAGTVTIDPNTDAQSATGGATAAGGTPQAAQFYTYGGPLQFVLVTRGALPTLNNAGGATMSLTQLTLNGPTTRYLTAAGLLDLRVGGTLAVSANQAEGVYTGSFQVTVTYY